jgi:type I restriction enzyme S subunit
VIPDLTPYPAYKDAGVPWLGQIPEHWAVERAKWLFRKMDRPVREFDEVVTCFRDGVVTLRNKRRIRGFTESIKEIGYQGVRHGDLVIHAMDAFAGAIGVADSDGKSTPVYAVCEPAAGADAYYYAYVVREMARSQWILALATGIRERSTDFRFAAFASQHVPVPPLNEQSAIVCFLDHANKRIGRYIGAKQKLIKLLEEEKQGIVHRAVTRGFDPNVRIRPSGVEWLGDVAEGWEVARLKTRLVRNDAGAWGDDFADTGTIVLRSTEQTVDGGWRIANAARRRLSQNEREATLLHAGDLVVTKSSGSAAHIGKTSLVTEAIESMKCGFSNFMQRLRLDRRTVPLYVWLVTNSRIGRDQFVYCSSTTTGLGNLSGTILGNIWVAFPPRLEQEQICQRIAETTKPIDRAIGSARREADHLSEYRTRLIADVVTGKLDVRDAAPRLPTDGDEPGMLDETKESTDEDELPETNLEPPVEEVEA